MPIGPIQRPQRVLVLMCYRSQKLCPPFAGVHGDDMGMQNAMLNAVGLWCSGPEGAGLSSPLVCGRKWKEVRNALCLVTHHSEV